MELKHDIHVHSAPDIVDALVTYCTGLAEETFTVVADENTHAVLGERVTVAMQAAGLSVEPIVLRGEEIVADEKYLMQVFLRAPYGRQVFVGVGSGTITDITRYASYRTGNRFISVPTAPSVDGFISLGAPLVVGGMKDTVYTHPPLAVFADLNTLAAAPRELIAAGYGDIIGKLTSLADWRLGHLLWDEPFDQAVADRVQRALDRCIEATESIAAGSLEGIQLLMDALLESGVGMLEFGTSRPASGAEHHCSHYWEMKLLEERKPAILHGWKVGYATTLIAAQYARLREMDHQALMDRLEAAEWPSREAQLAEIRQGYGAIADDVASTQQAYLDLAPEDYEAAKRRTAERWDAIQAVLADVPAPAEIKRLLGRVGVPTDGGTLGIEERRVPEALRYGHYLRGRFTVLKLLKLLDMPPEV